MSETITHAFVSKKEVSAPDPSTGFIGKHEVTIDATYDGETKRFTELIGTNSSFSDDDLGIPCLTVGIRDIYTFLLVCLIQIKNKG